MEELLKRIEALEKEVEWLKQKPVYYAPIFTRDTVSPLQSSPANVPHYHNGAPCYKNPCVTC